MGLKALRRTNLGPFENEGARLLWLYLQKRKATLSDLAKELGTKPGMLNRWAWCDVRPSSEWTPVLEDKLGIPMRAWRQAPAEKFAPLYDLPQAAAAASAAGAA